MKRLFRSGVIGLLLAISILPAAASTDSRRHHAAMKVCKQQYKNAVRGAKYLKGHQRRARIAQARTERAEC